MTPAALIAAAPNPADLTASAEWFANVLAYAKTAENRELEFDARCGLMFCDNAPRVVQYVRSILSVLKTI